MSEQVTTKHIEDLVKVVQGFCTETDLAAIAPVASAVDLALARLDAALVARHEIVARHETLVDIDLTIVTRRNERREAFDNLDKVVGVIAKRILGELNDHQGEYREALDHLNGVIAAPLVNGERDYRCQLSAIREALRLLASRQGVSV